MYIGDTYSDAGAEAIDDVDGNITDKIMVTGLINPDKPGLYTLTYNVKDNQGNEALPVTRDINVIDNVDPIITFNPEGNEVYAKSRSTVVTVRDPNSGVKGSSLKYLWNTSTTEPSEASFSTSFANGGSINTLAGVSGSYYLWVFAQDNSGNSEIKRSNVFRLDNEKPVITINGNSNITINKGSTYSDAGATVTDNIDATVTVTTTGSVNPNIVGTYTITYNATDSSGNVATPVTRTINVIDVKAPVITILGSNPATVSGGGNQEYSSSAYLGGSPSYPPTNGIRRFGGSGEEENCGGGGGGYVGGTGGLEIGSGSDFTAYGGAGGSGYTGGVTDGSMQSGIRTGNGYAKITYVQ